MGINEIGLNTWISMFWMLNVFYTGQKRNSIAQDIPTAHLTTVKRRPSAMPELKLKDCRVSLLDPLRRMRS